MEVASSEPSRDTRGVPLYHMLFPTDSEAGTRLVEHVYRRVAGRIPAMQ